MFPGSFSMGGWWIIFPIIGLIILLVYMYLMFIRRNNWSYRHETRRVYGEKGGGTESALDFLKKRFASGEITKEDYETMNKDLLL